MTQRPLNEPKSNDSERKRSSLGFPLRVSRTQQMGNRGLAAASIGWTLAGCIIVGFAVGAWLDKRLGTQIWTPILFLVGVFAGFREMFRTLAQISQAPKPASSSTQGISARARPKGAASEPQVLEAPTRQRVFSVPPPPFMEQPEEKARGTGLDSSQITRQLLGETGEEAVEKRRPSGDSEETRDAV